MSNKPWGKYTVNHKKVKTLWVYLIVCICLVIGVVILLSITRNHQRQYDHVFIIGIDGAGNNLQNVDAPFFQSAFLPQM